MGSNLTSMPEEMASKPEVVPVFRSRSLEDDEHDKRTPRFEVKFAILGVGGCGKTTLVKQICLLNGIKNYGYDRENTIECIIECFYTAALQIYRYASSTKPQIQFSDIECAKAIQRLCEQQRLPLDKKPIYASLFNFFKDPVVLKIMHEHRDVLHISDGVYAMLSHLEKYNNFGIVNVKVKDRRTMRGLSVTTSDQTSNNNNYQKIEEDEESEVQVLKCLYEPNDEDYILASRKTTGIVEIKVNIDADSKILLVANDGGGQRNERKKWLIPLSGARAIVFVATLADFYQVAYEDDTTNRLTEQVNTFSKYVNRFISQVDCILLFNKSKLLKECMEKYSISDYFPEYLGRDDKDFESVRDFIVNKFLSVVPDEYKEHIIVRFVEAIETTSVANLMSEPFWRGEGLRDNHIVLNSPI